MLSAEKRKNNPKNPFSTAIGGSNGRRSGLFHHSSKVNRNESVFVNSDGDFDDEGNYDW
ncbi:hypothetical protein [Paenibacillus konkukensis]|uniref:hypothetical protein n=1 Tax=Paenibacillus konkukensis TaxID=2020716 RepID=UPI00201E2D4E|nr:hypothetical protein [Paenibacillus konkukensis]